MLRETGVSSPKEISPEEYWREYNQKVAEITGIPIDQFKNRLKEVDSELYNSLNSEGRILHEFDGHALVALGKPETDEQTGTKKWKEYGHIIHSS